MEKQCEFCGVLIEGYRRSTKKYCSDNCKQLAFYARQGMNWGKAVTDELNSVKPDFTLNGKAEETAANIQEKGTQQSNEQTQQVNVTVKSATEAPGSVKSPYHWMKSPLVEAIENYRNQTTAESMFSGPEYFWTEKPRAYVYWVTLRFRCLLENIIRLSTFKTIDRNTLQAISKAFADLTDSCYFADIPRNYPFISLIVQLRDKFSSMTKQLHGDEITLRLSINRKAELMAARFVIGDFVPRMGFSQLVFSDGVKEKIAKEFNSIED